MPILSKFERIKTYQPVDGSIQLKSWLGGVESTGVFF